MGYCILNEADANKKSLDKVKRIHGDEMCDREVRTQMYKLKDSSGNGADCPSYIGL